MLLILIVIVLASVSKLKVFFCLLNQCNRGNNHSNNSFSTNDNVHKGQKFYSLSYMGAQLICPLKYLSPRSPGDILLPGKLIITLNYKPESGSFPWVKVCFLELAEFLTQTPPSTESLFVALEPHSHARDLHCV